MKASSKLRQFACVLAMVAAAQAHAAATITIVNTDPPGTGLNDPTAATPVGGNSGTTLGEQRQIALQYAASIWAATLDSSVEIEVSASFATLFCDSSSAVLASAGATTVHRDFAGAPVPNTWYPQALANKLAGTDLDPLTPDIDATFNSVLGTSCAFPRGWYYGLDANAGGDIDLVTVAMHEIAHGLGFMTLVDESTGHKLLGFDDAYMGYLEDHSTGKLFPEMTNGERVAAMVDTGDLHWVGPSLVAASSALTNGVDPSGHVEMYAPDPVVPGSSVSHFSNAVAPDELMEPVYTAPEGIGLTGSVLQDVGWGPVISDCGNGALDGGEECDDGNTARGDGCDSLCHVEQCYACYGVPSVCSPLPDGSACDDQQQCTVGDVCQAGVCSGTPATGSGDSFVVDTPVDMPDAAPGDGLCATGSGTCSLRAAVQEANELCGLNSVYVPASTYVLSLGAIHVTDSLDIIGSGAASTVIDSNAADRVLVIDAGEVAISDITIRNGVASSPPGPAGSTRGGCLNISSASVVTLTDTIVTACTAATTGGGISSAGTLTLANSIVSASSAVSANGGGGGIENQIGSPPVTLTSSRITGCTAAWGGGLLGSANLTASTVSDNSAGENGGGLLISSGIIDSSTIANNTAGYGGGGISARGSAVAITNSTITGNSAGGEGGGILVDKAQVTLTDSEVRNNTAGEMGGGISNSSATTVIENATLSGNSATNGVGGAVANQAAHGTTATVEITNSSITGNTALYGGGGIFNDGGVQEGSRASLILSAVSISGNSTAGGGGAILNRAAPGRHGTFATVDATNVTISDNTADDSGGVRNTGGALRFINCTISGNSAAGGGPGGLSNTVVIGSTHSPDRTSVLNSVTIAANTAGDTSHSGGIQQFGPRNTLELENSIVADNTNENGPLDCRGGLTSGGYNLIENVGDCTLSGATGKDLIGVDPMLGPLQDNGGSTLTRALLPGSPALAAGALASGQDSVCPATDQRGLARPRPAGTHCDIGAYERDGCQDGTLDPGEQCDDGNAVDGDGCSAICQKEQLSGRRLVLATTPGNPGRSRMFALSKDGNLALGAGNFSTDDPVLHGASLRLASSAGDAFDSTYDLPAANWSYIGAPGANQGYRYKDPRLEAGPIRRIGIKPERWLRIAAGHADLGYSLGANPDPVAIVLTVGTKQYCLLFGGVVSFRADRAYRAIDARPGTCPP